MWFRVEMVLFKQSEPGESFLSVLEGVLTAWQETPAYRRGCRLQVWECAQYLKDIWWVHFSCTGYRGVNSDIDFKQWFHTQWVETSAYAKGQRVQVWNVDSYDSAAALFAGITVSRSRTITESIDASKPDAASTEVLKSQLWGVSAEDAVASMQKLANAAAKVPDTRLVPSAFQAFCWHVMACIWPTANYARWIAGEHPRWKRR